MHLLVYRTYVNVVNGCLKCNLDETLKEKLKKQSCLSDRLQIMEDLNAEGKISGTFVLICCDTSVPGVSSMSMKDDATLGKASLVPRPSQDRCSAVVVHRLSSTQEGS